MKMIDTFFAHPQPGSVSRISDGGTIDLSGVFPIYFSSEFGFLFLYRVTNPRAA